MLTNGSGNHQATYVVHVTKLTLKDVFPLSLFNWSTDKELDNLFWKHMIRIVTQQEALRDNPNNGGKDLDWYLALPVCIYDNSSRILIRRSQRGVKAIANICQTFLVVN